MPYHIIEEFSWLMTMNRTLIYFHDHINLHGCQAQAFTVFCIFAQENLMHRFIASSKIYTFLCSIQMLQMLMFFSEIMDFLIEDSRS